jgi:regulator of sigma E protease
MLDFLWTLASFLFAFAVLVTVHEFGHFWVARRCGIEVLNFSIGFGPTLFSWSDRQGTVYSIAAIPLGGYVRMLDQREAAVPEHKKHVSFNAKSVWQRSAVVAAGPLANFIFAVLAFWGLMMMGQWQVKPVVVKTVAGVSKASYQLDSPYVIESIEGREVQSYQDVEVELAHFIGHPQLNMVLKQLDGTKRFELNLDALQWNLDDNQGKSLLEQVGLISYQPVVELEIASILPNSPAAKSSLSLGDKILALNQIKVESWQDFVERVQQSESALIQLLIQRDQQELEFSIELAPLPKEPERFYIGITPKVQPIPNEMRTLVKYDIVNGLWHAVKKTADLIDLSVAMIKKLLIGHVSVQQLGGPIAIAQGAGQSASYGFSSFLFFLAFFSVNLGVLNLLPLPLLDGGHLLYNVYEIITGRPLPDKIQEFGLKIGAIFLFILMSVVIINDFSRL